MARLFLLGLFALLVAHMLLGRGLAQLGSWPVYAAGMLMVVGSLACADALVRRRLRLSLSLAARLLIGFMLLGLVRTVPYMTNTADPLQDVGLWAYAGFALLIYWMADRAIAVAALRPYGWAVRFFAWLPVTLGMLVVAAAEIPALTDRMSVPTAVFESEDVAVHIVGSLAFVVLGTGVLATVRPLAWRTVIVAPLLLTAVAVATSRGALVSVTAGTALVVALGLSLRRSSNLLPLVIGSALLAVMFGAAGLASPRTTGWPAAGGHVATGSPLSPSARPIENQVGTACVPALDARSVTENPGFEAGMSDDGGVPGWNVGGGRHEIVASGGYRGARYALMQTRAGVPAAITSCSFPFEAGHDLSVSLWAKAIHGSGVIATRVTWYDTAGMLISTSLVRSLATNGLSTWQQSAGVITAPVDTAQGEVQLVLGAADAGIGIDEVLVESVSRACAPISAPGSPIANAGFDLGTRNDGRIDGWAIGPGFYDEVATGVEGHGSFAFMRSPERRWAATLTSCRFRVDPGDDVGVSLAAKAIIASPVVYTYIRWYDASGTRTGTHPISSLATGAVTTWQQSGGVRKAPANALFADVLLRQPVADAMIGIDAVVVTIRASDSLVTNAGFELGIPDDGSISGWQLRSGSGAIVRTDAHRGDGGAVLQSADDAYSAAMVSTRFPVDAGGRIWFSLQLKAVVGSPSAAVFIDWYHADGSQLASVPVITQSLARASRWASVTGGAAVPATAASGELVIWEASGGGAALGVDDVIVGTGDPVAQCHRADPAASLELAINGIASLLVPTHDDDLDLSSAATVAYGLGEELWTGSGFGSDVGDNRAAAGDHGSPANAHQSVLARMGVVGFVLWVALLGTFFVDLLAAVVRSGRAGDAELAALGAWVFVYSMAAVVNMAFDPFLGDPEGALWFWSLFGLGMMVTRVATDARIPTVLVAADIADRSPLGD